jgi:chloramphenicol O-acetyltransferase type B
MSYIIYYWAKLLKKLRLSAVKNSFIHKTSKIESGTSFNNSVLGKYSFCGYDCEITNTQVGNFCSIANNVVIGGATHPMKWVGMSPVFYAGRDSVTKKFSEFNLDTSKNTFIGNDVWIGRSAIILSGVNVGNGAVIGAGSIVTKDVPAYAIVVGNSAKIIRYRFDHNTINKLESLRWWDFNDSDLAKIAHNIKDVDLFIQAANSILNDGK